MTELEALLVLSQSTGFSKHHFEKLKESKTLLSDFVSNPADLMGLFSQDELTKLAESIQKAKTKIQVGKIQEQCTKNGVRILSFDDPHYPKLLQEIHNPPLILYVKGTLIPEDEIAIAMVGSRHATPYGIRVARRIAYELSGAGVTVVSGLARGIDAYAHRGALEGRGRTLAVLGCGIDIIYPKENLELYQKISENGAILSEYPIGTEPMAYHFPVRNRIIAGLSHGVLVVEAGHRSGSLITATFATEAGREIYVVPGQIDSMASFGTNALIQQGAKVITSSQDILEDLEPILSSYLKKETVFQSENVVKAENDEENDQDKKFLSRMGKSFFTLDDAKSKSNFDYSELNYFLMNLELKGKIRKRTGGTYETVYC